MPIMCPACGDDAMTVKDSRHVEFMDITTVRRRRVCNSCEAEHFSYEVPAHIIEDLQVRSLS
jgi:transcriptional regulator NrdR family protein